jgi:hypothetical protein
MLLLLQSNSEMKSKSMSMSKRQESSLLTLWR